MRSRIAGGAWDDDEPTISVVMVPDESSEPRLEIGEEDFIRMEPQPSDWRIAPEWSAPDPAAIPKPPRVPSHIWIPGTLPRTDAPQAPAAQQGAPPRVLPQGRRPKPPAPTLPRFPTNSNPGMPLPTPAPEPPVIELVSSRALPTDRPSSRRRERPAVASSPVPLAQTPSAPAAPYLMTPSSPPHAARPAAVMMTPSSPPGLAGPAGMMMTPSAPPTSPPFQVAVPSVPPDTPPPPYASPSAWHTYGQAGAPPQGASPPASSSIWSVSPVGVIAAVAAAVVVALVTVALMVWLTQPEPTKPVRVDAPAPTAAAPAAASSSAAASSALAASSAAAPASASAPAPASSGSLAELAAKGDIDALMQLRARKPEDRTAEESLALARGRSVRKRAALDELAQKLRSDLPLSADRTNLAKLREYLDDGETTTDALAVLASIGTPMAVDMIFDVGSKAPARSDTRAVVDDLMASKDLRSTASPALAVVLDLREIQSCDDAWRILPRAIENADRRALPELEQLRVRTGCGRYKSEDCYRCLRGNDDLDKAIRWARSRAAPDI